MEKDQAKKVIETLLYMTDHPLATEEILEVLEEQELTKPEINAFLGEIKMKSGAEGSALQMVEVAGGVQMATRPEMAPYIRRLYKERLTVRLSSSALETLSIIAYKQPITRSEIEQIRGVEAVGVMETLLERRLIKVVGRKETIGRPLLYGTTVEFLRQFGLKHLADLPDLHEGVPEQKLEPPVETSESPLAMSAASADAPATLQNE
ncbi:MAG: SMC-Scp complex subunit ScpB [Elusimicrobia bacterium]|nr:SMC-Scp complex subunit ScpB [Candidatus Obscuribacterium magneticum]